MRCTGERIDLLRILVLGLFLLCAACAKENERFSYIDPEIAPYVDIYREYKADRLGIHGIRKMNIFFAEQEYPRVGVCVKWSNGDFDIQIDKRYWDYASDLDREVLILHELGHCDLGLEHSDPSSIMEPYHIGAENYLANQNYYINELFSLQPTIDLGNILSMKTNCKHSEEVK